MRAEGSPQYFESASEALETRILSRNGIAREWLWVGSADLDLQELKNEGVDAVMSEVLLTPGRSIVHSRCLPIE